MDCCLHTLHDVLNEADSAWLQGRCNRRCKKLSHRLCCPPLMKSQMVSRSAVTAEPLESRLPKANQGKPVLLR